MKPVKVWSSGLNTSTNTVSHLKTTKQSQCVCLCACVCVVSLEWLAHLLKHMQEEDNNNDNKKIERKKGNSTNAN